MTQSFDGVVLDGVGSIVNFGNGRPPQVMDVPSRMVNSNSRTSAILLVDGVNSVPFTGTYTILTGQTIDGQYDEYALIKAKQGTSGTLINGSQTIQNVALLRVSLAQHLGAGVLQCNLVFELAKV